MTGLPMRQKASHTAGVVATQPVGAVLRVVEDDLADVRRRIGKKNEWVFVRDNQKRRGYVLSLFVAEQKNTVVSFDILELTGPEPLDVTVSSLAGKNGLLLRIQPNSASPSVKSLPVGTALQVLDDPLFAEKTIGVFNMWLKVKEPQGAKGYVPAWFVEK
jgi:hypothetical protein